MSKPIVRDPIYRRRRFDAEIIELCVRWYITYRLSYRDLAAMMAEREIIVSHTTVAAGVDPSLKRKELRCIARVRTRALPSGQRQVPASVRTSPGIMLVTI